MFFYFKLFLFLKNSDIFFDLFPQIPRNGIIILSGCIEYASDPRPRDELDDAATVDVAHWRIRHGSRFEGALHLRQQVPRAAV